jgi:DNA-binding NarL/FixJ family response regulator
MRILLADDHTLFRRSLAALLAAKGFEVVGEAESGPRAVELAIELAPDVVLMDLDMPGIDGVEATRRLVACQPEVRVVILTGSFDDTHLLEALEVGAQGYLLKTLEPERLFEMLEQVLAGEPALSPGLANRALQRLAQTGRAEAGRRDPMELTEREEEVLRWLAGGVTSTRALAGRLGVSERTIKFHIGNLLEKLQVESRAEAVSYALRHGLVEPMHDPRNVN